MFYICVLIRAKLSDKHTTKGKMLNHCLTRLAVGSTTTHLFHSRNMHLLLNKTLVNGDWVSASSKKELAVLNPVNGSIVGNVPDMDASDTQRAIDSASKAFYSKEWYNLTAKDRSNLLKVIVMPMRFFHLQNLLDISH